MDIEKLKADFEQSECFKRLEHVAQYTFFEFGAYIKRTDVPDEAEKKHGKMILALILSWSAWKEANLKIIPEGCVVVPKEISYEEALKITENNFQKHSSTTRVTHRALNDDEFELLRQRWIEAKAMTFQKEYQDLVNTAQGLF